MTLLAVELALGEVLTARKVEGGRLLAILATCVAWMCARLRLALARPALQARGCAVPVAPPSATTTQQGEHVVRVPEAPDQVRARFPDPSTVCLTACTSPSPLCAPDQ